MSEMTAFSGDFTLQESIGAEAVEAAVQVMRSGRLHRYNTAPGEHSETALLEQEYAAWQGSRFCLACASGGTAMQLALRAAGVRAGEPVLTNAYTLAPVPGAITATGARALLVGTTPELVIDLEDLDAQASDSKARCLVLSHMRGHQVDMDRLMRLVERHDLCLIEDCAHTMGARWKGRLSGSFGHAACFSTQSYKHLNSGEGGLLTSDDDELMARAVVLSGSYMLYERHLAAPGRAVFERVRLTTPNCSGRMDNLRAAMLRPQLRQLDRNIDRWNARYAALAAVLGSIPGLIVPARSEHESFVGSSLQFSLPALHPGEAPGFVAANQTLGVELKWFGDPEPRAFTSRHQSWAYLEPRALPETDQVLDTLFDLRIPLTFSAEDCEQIGNIIAHCCQEAGLSD